MFPDFKIFTVEKKYFLLTDKYIKSLFIFVLVISTIINC